MINPFFLSKIWGNTFKKQTNLRGESNLSPGSYIGHALIVTPTSKEKTACLMASTAQWLTTIQIWPLISREKMLSLRTWGNIVFIKFPHMSKLIQDFSITSMPFISYVKIESQSLVIRKLYQGYHLWALKWKMQSQSLVRKLMKLLKK